MVLDAMRGYVQIANGVGDVTKQRATQVAKQLLEQGGEVLGVVAGAAGSAEVGRQVQGLADDLLALSRTNRDVLVGLIRTEIDRAVARLGLVGADELSSMARVVERLQTQLDAAIAFGSRGVPAAARKDTPTAPAGTPSRPSPRREPMTFAAPPREGAAATKPATKKPGTKKAAKKVTATKNTAKKVPAKKVPAKKVPAKKVPAKKVPAEKAPVAKATVAPADTSTQVEQPAQETP